MVSVGNGTRGHGTVRGGGPKFPSLSCCTTSLRLRSVHGDKMKEGRGRARDEGRVESGSLWGSYLPDKHRLRVGDTFPSHSEEHHGTTNCHVG